MLIILEYKQFLPFFVEWTGQNVYFIGQVVTLSNFQLRFLENSCRYASSVLGSQGGHRARYDIFECIPNCHIFCTGAKLDFSYNYVTLM